MSDRSGSDNLQDHRFPVQVTVATRFGDFGPGGTLGSVAYARYFEQARVAFIDQLLESLGAAARELPLMVVASVAINDIDETRARDAVQIGIGVSRIGRTSFGLAAACLQRTACLATHEATMVLRGCSAGFPPSLRAALEAACISKAN